MKSKKEHISFEMPSLMNALNEISKRNISPSDKKKLLEAKEVLKKLK